MERKPAFVVDLTRLTPTVHETSITPKVQFIRQFVHFAEDGFQYKDFPKWFYTRLSMCFGFIAHYNQATFFHHFFVDVETPSAFFEQIMEYPCYGKPEYTYCDAEKIIQEYLRSKGY